MRIDTIKPQPAPEIPKVSQGGSASAYYNNSENNSARQSDSASGGSDSVGVKSGKSGDKADSAQQTGKKIQFKIHRNPSRVITQIVDKRTNEVVDELPPEKSIDSEDTKTTGRTIDKKV